MAKYNLITRIVSFMLVLVIFVGSAPKSNAAVVYNKATMDKILENWNKTDQSKSDNKAYEGAKQCAAFTRYAFMNLWGHTDGQAKKDNKVVIAQPFKNLSSMMDYLIANAKPGDSIRITKNSDGEGGHIFHLFDIDGNKQLHVYDSNYGGAKDPLNKGRFNIFELSKFLGNDEMKMTSIDKYGKFSRTVYMTIIHAKTNTDLQLTYNGIKLDANGGAVSKNTVTTKNGVYGSFPKPVRDGYTFNGWYTAKTGGTKVSEGSKVVNNGDFCLYAQWKKCNHKEYYGGICKTCNIEAAYKITSMKAAPYIVTKSGGAPAWARPYSENSSKVQTYKKNSIVSVIGNTTNVNSKGKAHNVWYLLSDGSWIYSGNVKKAIANNIYYVVGTNGYLNMKKSNSNDSGTLIKIPEGASVEATFVRKGSWHQVIYNGVKGYVPSANLVTLPSGVSFYTAVKDTAIKASTSSGAKNIATVKKGNTVVVFTNRISGNYHFVSWNKSAGYVAKNDLKYFR